MTESKIKEKRFTPEDEKIILEEFSKDYDFTYDINSTKKTFSIDTPPAYPSGDPHPGQMAHYMKIDMIARTARMQGYEVLFPMGLDRNGIQLEMLVEKKHGKKMQDMDREFFVNECKTEMDKIGKVIYDFFKRAGVSADFDHDYATDSDEYRAFSQAQFIKMWNQGLIKEDLRPNMYCPGCKTSIAEAEIVYEELPTMMNTLKFKVVETGEEIHVGTTRPELLCACKAILVHPDDERYKHLHGKHARVPIYNNEIPIYAHTYAKPEFGTGIVMICSYGDTSDVQIFRELKLQPVAAIDINGNMTGDAGFVSGLPVKEARKKILEKLKQDNILEKQEEMLHRTPTCERSKDPLEFISLKEWYIKQLPFLENVRNASKQMDYLPKKQEQILHDWIDSITIDWPISRRRYYHTEIPLWYCKSCGEPLVPEPGRYYKPWKEKAPFEKCPKCGGTEFVGEEKTFDTWVDSSLSSLFISGFDRNDKLFEKAFPVSMRPQGPEIVRTWLYYTILRNVQLLNEAPFKHVWIDGLGLADDGKKMSKSRGNYIEPMPLIDKYGADAYRFWAASEANYGEFYRLSEERINGAAKFINKLWNISKFISMFPEASEPEQLKETDKWILEELNHLIKKSKEGYEKFNFFVPTNKTKEFLMNQFASHYVEMVKSRAYDGDESARYTLHTCLKSVLKLLAPITPFITHRIYKSLYDGKIHYDLFPEYKKPEMETVSIENTEDNTEEKIETRPKYLSLTQDIMDFNSKVWKTKKDKGVSLKSELSDISVPNTLLPFKEDLIRMHNIK